MGAVADKPLVDVRTDFPVLAREFGGRRVAYLDSAATSQRPQPVIEAMDRFQRESYAPIHRGVFVARKLLGRTLRPPPEAVTPLSPDLHPNLSTRQRTIEQTSAKECQSCHAMINPLGFSLENFDAVGRSRQREKEKDIDASGSYNTLAGETVNFTGPRELAAFLSASPEAHTAFVDQLFHYTVKQPIRAHGAEAEARITQSFVDNGFNMQKLLVEITTTAALRETTSGLASTRNFFVATISS